MNCPQCQQPLPEGTEVCPRCTQQATASTPPPPPVTEMPPVVTTGPDTSGSATAGLVLGIIGLLAWCLPLLGLPVTIVGLILAQKGLTSVNAKTASTARILCLIGLSLSVINAIAGIVMALHKLHL